MTPNDDNTVRAACQHPSPRYALFLLGGLWVLLTIIRVTGPLDLMSRDQEKTTSYVLDLVLNGHFVVQYDALGEVSSKPPFNTWLAGAAVWLMGGEMSRLAMATPTALAVALTTLLLYRLSRQVFGGSVAFWTAFVYLASNTSYRQLALMRTDTVFALTVLVTLYLGYGAWRRPSASRWFGFWAAAAISTLTKGPLGPVLASLGFVAAFSRGREDKSAAPTEHSRPLTLALSPQGRGEGTGGRTAMTSGFLSAVAGRLRKRLARVHRRGEGTDAPAKNIQSPPSEASQEAQNSGAKDTVVLPRGRREESMADRFFGSGVRATMSGESRLPAWAGHVAGVVAYVILCGGWFWLGWQEAGQPFIDKLIRRELVGHSVGSFRPVTVVEPVLYVLTRFLPWSLLGFWGLWRLWRAPAPDRETRAFERFLGFHLVLGLMLFSLATHKREDLTLPLLPGFAILAGREMDRLFVRTGIRRPCTLAACLASVLCVTLVTHKHYVLRRAPYNVGLVSVRELARGFGEQVGPHYPFTNLTPHAFQYFLNTMRPAPPSYRRREVLESLLAGDDHFVLIVDNRNGPLVEEIITALGAPPLHTLAAATGDQLHGTRIMSNHPRLEYTPRMAAYVHGLIARMRNVLVRRLDEDHFVFEASASPAWVEVENVGRADHALHIEISGADGSVSRRVRLGPGERAKVACEINSR